MIRNELSNGIHLTSDDLASYHDRRLGDEEQERVEAHLASCLRCRAEFTAGAAILRKRATARRRRLVLGPAVGAAAAVILLLTIPGRPPEQPSSPAHRDAPGAGEEVPTLAAPLVTVEGVEALRWVRIARADRYRVTLFDASGTVLWKAETRDTAVTLPDSVRLSPDATYMWQVEARVGIDRWVASELRRFTIERDGTGETEEARQP